MTDRKELQPSFKRPIPSPIGATGAMIERQGRFLEGYRKRGNVQDGLERAQVARRTYHEWRQFDVEGFRDRLREAYDEFCDSLEAGAHDLALATKPGGNPLMYITLLNANLPEKYRQKGPSENMDARALLEQIKVLAREEKERRTQVTATEATEQPALPDGVRAEQLMAERLGHTVTRIQEDKGGMA